jgi:tetratricopeptide (TPR) repeat protein
MRSICFILIFFASANLFAQNDLLAKNYYEQGNYEKALAIYNKLYKKNPGRTDYAIALVTSYQQLERFPEAEAILKARIVGTRINPQFIVELGYNYSLQNQDSIASNYYQEAIRFLDQSPIYATTVAITFQKHGLLDEAVQTFERGMKLTPERDYTSQLASLYGEQGKLDKMFDKYIELIERKPSHTSIAQRNFSLYITEDPLNEANVMLRKSLLTKLQKEPKVLYNTLLSWLFIQQKDFKKAFTQEKAIYKRTDEDNLSGIVTLALITMAAEDYENAEVMINFTIENAPTPEFKMQGYQYLMKIILETATEKEYPAIEQQFEELLTTYGKSVYTYLLQIDYNHFLAFKAGKKALAISNLKALSKANLNARQEAKVKMELADILVFDEKFNKALIYYSQIQSKIKSDVIAQEARFKVARTSYFKGDFPWAKLQLEVLRKSASQLIANDAMELSLMISDNSLEDSTQTALKKFARADLLSLQLKNREAVTVLDELLLNHKGESIEDEALLMQGELYEKLGEFNKAAANYKKLIEFYNDDILADDAHYKLARLYEFELHQPEIAKAMYEQIIFNFKDSIYFVEARKKFRILRGDEIN